jgi:Trypsin-like peptidase domain
VTSRFGHVATVRHLFKKLNTVDPATLRFKIQIGAETQDLDQSAIVFQDILADLLILKIPSPGSDRKFLCLLPKGAESSLQINDTLIYTSGFPESAPYMNKRGTISSFDGGGNTWLTDAAIYEGMSGSPVYTASGQVLALGKGEYKRFPGTYAIIAVPNVRSQLQNFTTECQVQNENASLSGPQTVDLTKAQLPTPTECVFLGKLSGLATNKPNDAPFGKDLVKRLRSGDWSHTGSSITPITDVNVRSNCPVVRGGEGYYGSITRVAKAGEPVRVGPYLTLRYAGDTWYWGQLATAPQ